MNRRMFLHLSGPVALIGVLLLAGLIGSAWTIQRLQRNLNSILAEDVASLEAAQELEINLRQLRFHSFMNLLDPRPDRLQQVKQASKGFENALRKARDHVNHEREGDLVDEIEAKYALYQKELAEGERPSSRDITEFARWADRHPVRHLQGPCKELLDMNKSAMEATAQESESVSQKTRVAMLILGILGPISGLLVGAIVARTWSRSIAQLSVRLQDVHSHLSQDVGEMTVDLSEDWSGIDRQLDGVVNRVKEAAAQLQRQQREILRAEQLAAVGQLAANVAHEIRNPFTSIKMLVDIALRTPAPSLTEEDLRVIRDEMNKVEQTVQGLLNYAKPPKLHRQQVNLRETLENAIRLVRPKADQHRVRISLHGADEASCRIDTSQMGSVVVNLLMNALDAMPDGGEIDVALERQTGGDVSFSVTDNGPGVAPAIADRLFEPFASTKPTGTGLGLSICQRVIGDHHGTIVYEPRPGGGSRFVVTLNESKANRSEVSHAALVGHR